MSSFNKTFIREARWKLFVEGVLTTLLITLLSILFGTALGFAVFMLCRNGNPVANLVTRFCLWLVQGMPMVVLLMILFYVIFGSVAISGIAVAVIGFTLTFGAAVFGLLKMGVGAVDSGQYEAAYALGYSNRRTFFRIILPQALPHVLPAYRGEVVGLIKATVRGGLYRRTGPDQDGRHRAQPHLRGVLPADRGDRHLLRAGGPDRVPRQPDQRQLRSEAPQARRHTEGDKDRWLYSITKRFANYNYRICHNVH